MLNQLQIEHNAIMKGGELPSTLKKESNHSGNGEQDQEILGLLDDNELLEKELENLNNRKKKINLVSDQVGGWANRVVSKLNSQLLGTEAPQMAKK